MKSKEKFISSRIKILLLNFYAFLVVDGDTNNNADNRQPRDVLNSNSFPTIYYICGPYPNTVYSLTPCQICRNGGKDLYVECTNPIQCTPYYRGTTACIDGRCCTAGYEDPANPYGNNNPYGSNGNNGNNPYGNNGNPNGNNGNPYGNNGNPYGNNPYGNGNPYGNNGNPYGNGNNGNPYYNGGGGGYGDGSNPYNPYSDPNKPYYEQGPDFGYCPRGERSNIRCSAQGQCPTNQICMSVACGGQVAIDFCQGGACQNGLICTASNYCCQCPIGRSGGLCNQGTCAPGYKCNLNGYCCAACPGNQTPFGACPNQQPCAGRFRCSAGDICCPDSLYNYGNGGNNWLTNGV